MTERPARDLRKSRSAGAVEPFPERFVMSVALARSVLADYRGESVVAAEFRNAPRGSVSLWRSGVRRSIIASVLTDFFREDADCCYG